MGRGGVGGEPQPGVEGGRVGVYDSGEEGDEEVDLYYPVFMSVRSILILLKFILKQSFIRFLFVFGWLRERLDYNEKSWK